MTTGAVKQAIELLQQRLTEARTEHDALTVEIEQIQLALNQLGIGDTAISTGKATPVPKGRAVPSVRLKNMTVSAATRTLLESERGPWTPALARDRLAEAGLQGKRSNADFTAIVRSAFYQMRKSGAAVANETDQTTIATKWLKDSEAPADTGASESERPLWDLSTEEGSSANGAAHPDGRGGDPVTAGFNRHGHGNRASIDGGTES